MLVNKPTSDMNSSLTNRRALLRIASLAVAIMSLLACVGPTPPAEAPATAAPVYVGAIDSVNREKNTVTIDLNSESSPPEPGSDLTAIASSGEATRLKVTAEAKRPRVSASVVSGSPKRGQRVYR
jgi:hypothetical protein